MYRYLPHRRIHIGVYLIADYWYTRQINGKRISIGTYISVVFILSLAFETPTNALVNTTINI